MKCGNIMKTYVWLKNSVVCVCVEKNPTLFDATDWHSFIDIHILKYSMQAYTIAKK